VHAVTLGTGERRNATLAVLHGDPTETRTSTTATTAEGTTANGETTTTTEGTATEPDEVGTTPTETDPQPGFGVAVALGALVATALLVIQRND